MYVTAALDAWLKNAKSDIQQIHILEEQGPVSANWIDLQPAGDHDVLRPLDSLRAHVSLTSSIEIEICFGARKRDDWPCVRAIRMFLNDPLLTGHPFRFLWGMLLKGGYLYSPGVRLEILKCDAHSKTGSITGFRLFPVDAAIEVLLAAGLIGKKSYGKRKEDDSMAYYHISHKEAHLGYLRSVYFVDPTRGPVHRVLKPTDKREWRGKSIPVWVGTSFAFAGSPAEDHREELENAERQRLRFEPKSEIPANTPKERPPMDPESPLKVPKHRDREIDPDELVPKELWMQ